MNPYFGKAVAMLFTRWSQWIAAVPARRSPCLCFRPAPPESDPRGWSISTWASSFMTLSAVTRTRRCSTPTGSARQANYSERILKLRPG